MFFFNILSTIWAATSIPAEQKMQCTQLEVWFPPKDNPTGRIVEFINKAKKSIYVQAYQLTSQPIADALLEAHKRGVSVVIVADKTQTGGSSCVPALAEAGLIIWLDSKPPIAHNKVFVIDELHVIGGSFNYSKNATKNAENCTFYENQPQIAHIYLTNVQRRMTASSQYHEYLKAKENRAAKKKK